MTVSRRVAVITGGSQGIGAGLVEAFLQRGHQVVATSRSIQPSANHDLATVAGDIGDPETGKRVIDEAMTRFGRVDTLVNNAGIFIPSAFTEYTPEQYAQILSTNLNGFFYISQQAIKAMEPRKSGHVVQISTSLIDQANSNIPSVLASVTKGGLNAATKSLAIEYASRGVRVNAVALGIIKTPMHAPETHEQLAQLHPLRRMGEISDIVDAVLYLDDAQFVTGEILHVDGGQSAGH
jgi:NAD(P)-dependent dehydrogenase (short-subunit alcohol dehydrogenase family)